MEFGSFMEFACRPNTSEAQAFKEAFDHVALAEELGLDGVWLAEAHFSPGRSVLASPLILASTIAARTKRMKIGTAVVILPLGNPLRIAEEAATVDQISQGRFEFGVGRSGIQSAYEGYNLPYAESRDRFWEYLEIIRQAWAAGSFSYQGRFLSYSDVCVVPAAAVIAETVVATVLAQAYRDKFAGDSMEEMLNNHRSFRTGLPMAD